MEMHLLFLSACFFPIKKVNWKTISFPFMALLRDTQNFNILGKFCAKVKGTKCIWEQKRWYDNLRLPLSFCFSTGAEQLVKKKKYRGHKAYTISFFFKVHVFSS